MKKLTMKRLKAWWIFSLVLALSACEEKKTAPQPVLPDIRPLDEIPGIFESHGFVGAGTSMNMLEFVADGNDTLYIRVNSQAVMGGVKVGDELNVIYNVTPEENVASVAVNLTALQHVWTQRGADGKEQSLELDSAGRASTYSMTIDYDRWRVESGLLLLSSPKKVGDEGPVPVDTFEIVYLTSDSLVLMSGPFVSEFERYN